MPSRWAASLWLRHPRMVRLFPAVASLGTLLLRVVVSLGRSDQRPHDRKAGYSAASGASQTL